MPLGNGESEKSQNNGIFHAVERRSEEVRNSMSDGGTSRLSLGLLQARRALDLTYGENGAQDREEMIELSANRILQQASRDPSVDSLSRSSLATGVVHEVSQRIMAQTLIVVDEARKDPMTFYKVVGDHLRTAYNGASLNSAQTELGLSCEKILK